MPRKSDDKFALLLCCHRSGSAAPANDGVHSKSAKCFYLLCCHQMALTPAIESKLEAMGDVMVDAMTNAESDGTVVVRDEW